MLATISPAEPWEEGPAVALFGALLEGLTKVYEADLQSYGVSSRDRLPARTGHPLRETCDRLAQAFGVDEIEVYLHRSTTTSDVVAELTDPPTLLVPQYVSELPEPQCVFMLARAFAALARSVHPVVTLGRREIARALTTSLRTLAPQYGADLYKDEESDRVGKRVVKALSRKNRKQFETVGAQLLSDPRIDLERWAQTLELTSTRAAALIANDLPAIADILRQSSPQLARLDGPQLVRSSASLSDLLRFWPTEPAMELRRQAGLL
jgi:hypothetical protein